MERDPGRRTGREREVERKGGGRMGWWLKKDTKT